MYQYLSKDIYYTDIREYEGIFDEIIEIKNPRQCSVCEKIIQPGSKMIKQKFMLYDSEWCLGNFIDYICLPCAEHWWEENSQINVKG